MSDVGMPRQIINFTCAVKHQYRLKYIMNTTVLHTLSLKQRVLLSVLSGILIAMMVILNNPLCSFIALIPLILAMHKVRFRAALLLGFVCGSVVSLFTSYWMLQTVTEFSNGKWLVATGVYVLSSVLLGLVLLLAVAILYRLVNNRHGFLLRSLAIASGWAVFEFLFSYFLTGSFWFHPALYKGLVTTNFLIQPAVFGGAVLVSFFCAWINATLALALLAPQRKYFVYTALVFAIFAGLSYTAILVYPESNDSQSSTIAVINTNQPVRLQWDEQTGNRAVQEMLRLNQEATALQASLKIWTEAVVPWTFRKDDDFLNAITGAEPGHRSGHIIGLLTNGAHTEFYNSAYYLEDMHGAVQRYDKRFPLAYAEVPLSIGAVPLLKGADVIIRPGAHSVVFNTLAGRAGITVCNESLVDKAYYGLAAQHPDFLVVISNDGWISNSDYLLAQHFYSARIHAVAYRKDIVVNSNLGYSGAFSSMGDELLKRKEETGFVDQVSLSKNDTLTFYARYPLFFICFYLCSLLLLIYPLNTPKKV